MILINIQIHFNVVLFHYWQNLHMNDGEKITRYDYFDDRLVIWAMFEPTRPFN